MLDRRGVHRPFGLHTVLATAGAMLVAAAAVTPAAAASPTPSPAAIGGAPASSSTASLDQAPPPAAGAPGGIPGLGAAPLAGPPGTVQCPHCMFQIKARPTSFDHLKGGPSTTWQEVA